MHLENAHILATIENGLLIEKIFSFYCEKRYKKQYFQQSCLLKCEMQKKDSSFANQKLDSSFPSNLEIMHNLLSFQYKSRLIEITFEQVAEYDTLQNGNTEWIKFTYLPNESSKQNYLEHWSSDKLVSQIDVTLLHDRVVPFGSDFGCAGVRSWNIQKTMFLYSAQKKCSTVNCGNNKSENGVDRYETTMGEKLSDITNVALFLYDAIQETVSQVVIPFVECLNDEYYPVQCKFISDSIIAIVAYPKKSIPMGYLYMTNRKTPIIIFDMVQRAILNIVNCIENGFTSLRMPIAQPGESAFWYFANEEKGPHCKPSQVFKYSLKDNRSILIPFEASYLIEGFSVKTVKNENVLILHSVTKEKSFQTIVFIYDDSRVKYLNIQLNVDKVVDYGKNGVLLLISTISKEPHLAYYSFSSKRLFIESVTDIVSCEKSQIFFSDCSFSSILLRPIEDGRSHLIITTHGGPHSYLTDKYSYILSNLLKDGFTIACINYPEDSLIGSIGTKDVDFVHHAIEAIRSSDSYAKTSFLSGSHGGYIGAWLSVKYKECYNSMKATFIMRNLVVNLLSMYYQSDIPDWCLEESGIDSEEMGNPLSLVTINQLIERSPVFFKHDCINPIPKTLLLLGAKDVRVPKSQGIEWYQLLANSRSSVDCYVFPNDGHAIESFREASIIISRFLSSV